MLFGKKGNTVYIFEIMKLYLKLHGFLKREKETDSSIANENDLIFQSLEKMFNKVKNSLPSNLKTSKNFTEYLEKTLELYGNAIKKRRRN